MKQSNSFVPEVRALSNRNSSVNSHTSDGTRLAQVPRTGKGADPLLFPRRAQSERQLCS